MNYVTFPCIPIYGSSPIPASSPTTIWSFSEFSSKSGINPHKIPN